MAMTVWCLLILIARARASCSEWSEAASSASRDVHGVSGDIQGIESLGSRPDQPFYLESYEGVQTRSSSSKQDLAQFDMVADDFDRFGLPFLVALGISRELSISGVSLGFYAASSRWLGSEIPPNRDLYRYIGHFPGGGKSHARAERDSDVSTCS